MERQELINGRKASSLIGMPVYVLNQARQAGVVKSIIYDAEHSRVIGFGVREPGFIPPEPRLIMFDEVRNLGQDAVMVESEQSLVKEKETPEISRVTGRRKNVLETLVLTERGKVLGKIADVVIDDSTGVIISYEITSISGSHGYLPAEKVLKVGPDAVIVEGDAEETFAPQQPTPEKTIESPQPMHPHPTACTPEQEIEMARGKVASQDVYDDRGNLIVAKGEEITEYVVHQAIIEDEMHDVAVAAGVECEVPEHMEES
ncbi:MAG: PRC-barrel domain-containing protein [Armatimonadota bacterium]|nr:PRC-barrel domain-containing protein [bacterium]